MDRLNVVLLTIDTLRADRLGRRSGGSSLTPNLDRLASSGICFEQAITGGSWTQAAFPVLLTSTYASMHGGCLGALSIERPSPVGCLAEHGYLTGGFSTSPLLGKAYEYDRGFQHFVELLPNDSDSALRRIRGGQRLLRSAWTHRALGMVGKQARPAQAYVSAAEVNDAVGIWLGKVTEPFFAWIHYMDVHWPYHLEETLTYPNEIAQAWKDLAHFHRMKWRGQALTPSQRERFIELYDLAVQYTDAQVGQLLEWLEVSGIADRTVVIVVADHGEEFMEHGRWGHVETNLHDEIVHVPLIIHLPDGKGKQVIRQQVRTLDVMPTVLDLCGCPVLDKIEGESLVPLWDSDRQQYDEKLAISERWRDKGDVSHIVAIRSNEFKLIWDVLSSEQPRFYNLHTDREEQQNVSSLYPEKVKELQVHVKQHLQRVSQTTPSSPNKAPELEHTVIERLRSLGYVE